MRTAAERELKVRLKKIAETSFVEGAICNVSLASFRCAMYESEENLKLFQKIKKIYKDNNLDDIEMRHSLGASDTSDLTQLGITCLDGFGTEGGSIHGLDEFAYIKSLMQSAKRLAAVAYCI